MKSTESYRQNPQIMYKYLLKTILLCSLLFFFSDLTAQSCVNLSIPNNACPTSLEHTLNVSGQNNNLGNNVGLDQVQIIIEHSWVSDLDIFLQAPDGTEVELSTDNGSLGDNYGNPNNCPNEVCVLAPWSSTSISTSSAPFIGTFQPEGDFSDFDGINPNGNWTLRVCDDGSTSGGGNLIYFNLLFVDCARPGNLTVVAPTSSGAVLDWTGNSNATQFDIEIQTLGTAMTGIPSAINISKPFTWTEGMELTEYHFRVRSNCPDGSVSEWSETQEFMTVINNSLGSCFNITIPDNACGSIPIEVSGIPGNNIGTDAQFEGVKIILNHNNLEDIDFTLIAPNGVQVVLSANNGGSGNYYGNPFNCPNEFTRFTPGASTAITAGTPPYIGDYTPEGNFANFDGINPNGIWTLKVCDNSFGFVGILKFIQLEIFSCDRPSNLMAGNLSSSGANLDWTPNGTATSYDLEIRPHGASFTGIPTELNVQKPFIWTGGNQITDYQYRVRNNCTSGGISGWSALYDFSTGLINPPAACVQIAIPDNNCLTMPITVSSLSGTSLGNNVVLDGVKIVLSHSNDEQIDLFLQAPNGTEILLSTDNGGTGNNYGNLSNCPGEFTRFAPWATTSITAGFAPFIGNFTPEGSFNSFNGQNPNGNWAVRVCDDESSSTGSLRYIELEFADCNRPLDPAAINLFGSGADLTWTQNGSVSSWDIEIKPLGIPFTGTPTHSNVQQPFSWVDGIPLTNYHFQVKSNCNNGGDSDWSEGVNFKTGIDNAAGACIDLEIPDNNCVLLPVSVSGLGGTSLGSDVVLDGIKIIIDHTWTDHLDIYLQTPNGTEIDLSSDNGSLSDDYGDPNNCPNEFTRFASWASISITDGSAPFIGDYIPEGNFSNFNGQNPNGTWTVKVCDDQNGQTGSLKYAQLEFADCARPSNLSVSNITGVGADLNWTDLGGASSWDIEIKPLGIAFDGTATNSNVSKPFTWTGGNPLTGYHWQVRSDCSSGGNSSWSEVGVFTTGIDHSSPICFSLNIPNNECETIPINVAGLGNNLGTNAVIQGVKIIIDHSSVNQLDIYLKSPNGTEIELSTDNGSFGDDYGNPNNCPNEFTFFTPFASTPITSGSAPFIGSYTPEGNFASFNGQNPNGTWTVRVCDDQSGFVGSWKYVELVLGDCYRPNNLTANNQTLVGADLAWTDNSASSSWDIEIQPIGTALTGIPTASNVNKPYTWTGGTAFTDYRFWVRSNCPTGGKSDWSEVKQFRTALVHPLANCLNEDIFEESCISIPFVVSGIAGSSLGTDVHIDKVKTVIEHPWVGDLDIFLQSSDGTEIELSTDNGSSGNNYGNPNDCPNVTSNFAAWAAISITDKNAPFIGNYRPEGNFSDFNGQNPNGGWSIKVCSDDDHGDGLFKYVEIEFSDCIPAGELISFNNTTTGATLDWTESGNANSWDIEIQPVLSAFTGTPSFTNISKPFTWNGGNFGNRYKFKIRSNCTASAEWSEGAVFNTDVCPNNGLTRLYVDIDAVGSDSGDSWGNAINDLQRAIHTATFCTNVTEIWVAEGTYLPTVDLFGDLPPISERRRTFLMETDVEIYGGFEGTEMNLGQRDIANNSTILSGDIGTANDNSDNSLNVIYMTNPSADTRLDGITIRGGNGVDGGLSVGGAGVLLICSSGNCAPTFANCHFTDNTTKIGAAMAVLGNNASTASPEIINCLFTNNDATDGGGAIYAQTSNSGICEPKLINCTLFGNTGPGHSVFATVYDGPTSPNVHLTNCIAWGGTNQLFSEANSTFQITNSIVEGGCPTNGTCNNLLTIDPLLVDPANGNYQISDCSPAMDAGTSSNAPSTDYIDEPRPVGAGYDIGAYELQTISNGNITCYRDLDGDNFGDPSNSDGFCSTCGTGYVLDNTDCDDNDADEFPGQMWYKDADGDDYSDGTSQTNCERPSNYFTAAELTQISGDCDDNDANEFPGQIWYKDADGDDFGDGSTMTACLRPANHFLASELISTTGDCNDNNGSIHPNATEVCDNIDNNCNSQIDENVQTTFYADTDNDGFGDLNNTTQACTLPSGYSNNSTDCDDNDANEFPGQTWYKDMDGDSYGDGTTQTSCLRPANYYLSSELTATTGDCNDNNANTYPGATEICDSEDNDCDSQIDEGVTFQDYFLDNDGDGFGAGTAVNDCQPPSVNHVLMDGDCNDNNGNIHPNATEICDNIDNNCNSQIDEGVQTVFYADTDNDGFGDLNNTTLACSLPAGYQSNHTDCDDNDANEFPGQTWYKDADGDDFGDGSTMTACLRPANHFLASELISTTGDCNDNDGNIHPNATEICDNIDNNCNSQIDESVQTTFYADTDNDGFGDLNNTTLACTLPNGYSSFSTDCDDTDANEFPGQIWYIDADGDGYGDGSTQTSCLRPANHYLPNELTATTGDCNDNNANTYPGATEICDSEDNDCDSQIDEGVQFLDYFLDNDGDGFGAGAATNDCQPPSVNHVLVAGDCNDNDLAIHPNATEVCDGIDNNCDSQIDEGVTTTYYADNDNDGYGDANNTHEACAQPSGFVTDNTDCDDNDSNEFPGQTWHKDADDDGFGDGTSQVNCERPADHFLATELTQTSGDCNDNDGNVHPNATEVCDGIDNNCNSQTDEGLLTTYYADNDNDGYGDAGISVDVCDQPTGFVLDNTDCDDNDANEFPGQTWYKDADGDSYSDGISQVSCQRPTNYYTATELTQTTGDCFDNNAAIYPNAPEICDGIDNDCNNLIDTNDPSFVDNTLPVPACLSQTIQLDENGNYNLSVNEVYDAGNSTDNCGVVNFIGMNITSVSCSEAGSIVLVEVTVEDDSNNQGFCNAEITVEDDINPCCEPPAFTTCPSGFTAAADISCAYKIGDLTNQAIVSGTCGVINVTQNPAPGSTLILGSHLVTFTALDQNGNQTTCDMTIEIADQSMPTAKCKNINAWILPNGTATIAPNQIDNGSFDNCALASLNLDIQNFDCTNIGANTVTLTVEDAVGLSDQCTATVNVIGVQVMCYLDTDGDGFGDINNNQAFCFACGTGYVNNDEDCNDTDSNIHPDASEICDGIDNNCDGQIDEGFDVDGDGFTTCAGDCDDTDSAVNPAASEVCDGIDNNCDGQIDEGFDVDGDGFSICNGDCDDNNISIFPGAPEFCDGIDNNCNGQIDEGFDADGDGYTICNNDCDDTDASIFPGAVEICDGIDNDCDGMIDNNVSGTHVGNFTLLSQADVDAFPNCISIIDGNLIIQGTGISNLNALLALVEVTGDVVIDGSSLPDFTGLDNLAVVGEGLVLSNNNLIINCFGLDNLNTVGAGLNIIQNGALQNLNGLEGLSSIQGDLGIMINFALLSLTGLENLATVNGNLNIINNFLLTDCCPIESLLTSGVGGMIFIMGNATGCENQLAINLACTSASPFVAPVNNCPDCPISAVPALWQSIVYPNPTNGMLNILLPENDGIGTIDLLDRLGRSVLKKTIIDNATSVRMNAEHLPEGVYFLQIRIGDEVEMKKVMIQNKRR